MRDRESGAERPAAFFNGNAYTRTLRMPRGCVLYSRSNKE